MVSTDMVRESRNQLLFHVVMSWFRSFLFAILTLGAMLFISGANSLVWVGVGFWLLRVCNSRYILSVTKTMENRNLVFEKEVLAFHLHLNRTNVFMLSFI